MLPRRFRAILRRQPFSHAQSRMFMSQPPRELYFFNLHGRSLPIFIIWPKYATHPILCDFERQPFSSSLSRTLISRSSRERNFYNFCARSLSIFIICLKYPTHTISHESETATFFARAIADANTPALPGSTPFIIFAPDRFK